MNKIEYHSNACSPQPSVVTVQSVEGIKGLADCVVHVIDVNSTFFVDSCHQVTSLSSSSVFVDNYQAATNPLGLAGQVCYDFAKNVAYVFNNAGEYRVFPLKEVA